MRRLLFASFGLLSLCSCITTTTTENHIADKTPKTTPLSINEAQEIFNATQTGITRSGSNGEPSEINVFAAGNIELDWDLATTGTYGTLQNVEVPMEATYDYYRFEWRGTTDADLYPVPRKTVIIKDPLSQKATVYFSLYIPDKEFAENHIDEDTQQWATRDSRGHFTGILLYTTLAGDMVAAGRYSNGHLQHAVSTSDQTVPLSESLTQLSNLLGDIYIARSHHRPATRGVMDNNEIEEVVCIGYAPKKKIKDESGSIKGEPPTDPFEDMGGGGSSPPSSLTGNSIYYTQKNNIRTSDPQVLALLDSIFQDCMGQMLIANLHGMISIDTGYMGSSSIQVRSYNSKEYNTLIFSDITIKMGSILDDITLMEELLHAYQFQIGTDSSERLNREIEAKMGWYLYRKRTGNLKNVADRLGGKPNADIFEKLRITISSDGSHSSDFNTAYENTIDALRSISAYRNIDAYPENPQKRNFTEIFNLMKDC